VHDYTDVKPKLLIAGIVVTLSLLTASGYIVRSYQQAFAHSGGHRSHRGYYVPRNYGSNGPLIWHPNSPMFCNSGTPSICHPSTPTMGNPSTPTMDNPSSDPGSQGEGNIGQPPGNSEDNGYPGDNRYAGGPIY
jgi:hypothetical protein